MKLSILLALLFTSTTILAQERDWDGCQGEGKYPWSTKGCHTNKTKAADACCDSKYEPAKPDSHKAACKVVKGENAYVVDKPLDRPCSDVGGEMICVLDQKNSTCEGGKVVNLFY